MRLDVIGRGGRRELTDAVAKLSRTVEELRAELADARRESAGASEHLADELLRLREILQVVYDREPEARERVRALRATASYERAYTDPEPLVSVTIPTWDRHQLLAERAIPSVFAQTYSNLEVVVVGDAAAPEAEEVVMELDDPRVRYFNLERRGPYPDDPLDRWHVAGVLPRGEAVHLARGAWIAPLDDDDAFVPDHVERLLDLARHEHAEVAYGQMRCLMDDGSTFKLGEFPPRRGHFGWQATLFHAGLRFFEMELASWLFNSPADWSACRRMLRAGVRFAMVEDVVVNHWESRVDPSSDQSGELFGK